MYPERRFYKASGQPQTLPRIYPSFREDLFLVTDVYLVYEGKNETTGRPIIKAHLNPLVPWIWIGLIIMVFGTVVALVPNTVPVPVTVTMPVRNASARRSGGLMMTRIANSSVNTHVRILSGAKRAISWTVGIAVRSAALQGHVRPKVPRA